MLWIPESEQNRFRVPYQGTIHAWYHIWYPKPIDGSSKITFYWSWTVAHQSQNVENEILEHKDHSWLSSHIFCQSINKNTNFQQLSNSN